MNSSSSSSPPLVSDLVFIGGGHAHVHVLKMLGMPPYRSMVEEAGIRITLITNTLLTPYSGMLPGYLAGHYTYEEIHLDLHRLCRFSNIRLYYATAEAITYERRNGNSNSGSSGSGWITCRDVMTGQVRPPVRYDCLSIDIGITPSLPNQTQQQPYRSVIPVKPIASFCAHYQQLQQRVIQQINNNIMMMMPSSPPTLPSTIATTSTTTTTFPEQAKITESEPITLDNANNNHDRVVSTVSSTDPFTILVVGGGAGGIEVALSIQHRLHQLLATSSASNNKNDHHHHNDTVSSHLRVILATRGSALLEGHNPQVQRTMLRVLRERNIEIRYHAQVVSMQQVVTSGRVKTMAILKTSSTDKPENNNNSINNSDNVIECDECLWCTSAVAPSWLSSHTPFPCSPNGGFLQVTSTLQVVDHPGVYAAGDCCDLTHAPRPKAGVFAVRAGPYLLHNVLFHLLDGRRQQQRHFYPQKTFLALISTGDTYAIASKGPYFSLQGKWVWKWKDYIDRAFMAKYQDRLAEVHHDMMTRQQQQRQRHDSSFWKELWNLLVVSRRHYRHGRIPYNVQEKGSRVLQAFSADPMRCGGCGAKVGSSTLSRVLAAIQQRQAMRRGRLHTTATTTASLSSRLDHDDVAVIPLPPNPTGGNMLYTIDYFRSMVSDPYLFGKICALHALSDIHAMGVSTSTSTSSGNDDAGIHDEINNSSNPSDNAPSITALALCVVPYCADESLTESTLMDLLSGGSDVLQDEQVRLVGGHTCEGMELSCGFSIQGFVPQHMALFRKRGGRLGDKLVLTKPIGTGALMAADMRVSIRAPWIEEAVSSMLRSNGQASRIAASSAYGPERIHACTDVTGFGLMGHLLEMLMANQDEGGELDAIGADINLSSVPMFQGALAASSQAIYSTLQVSNHHNRRAVANHAQAADIDPIRYPLLFDPQTAGGLLFFVEPNVCHAFVADLQQFYPDVSIIGEVVPYHEVSQKFADGNGTVADDFNPEEDVCTIGSGGRNTGKRIHIVL